MQEDEEWRDVVGWEGLYQVSSFGRVKSLSGFFRAKRKGTLALIPKAERILKVTLTAGYPSVALCRDGKCKTTYIHRVVCEAWYGPCDGKDVAHNDGTKTNNRPDNLRWATRQENMADKCSHGTQMRGDDLWFTKVSDEQVRSIRRTKGQISATKWAKKLGVSSSLIGLIRSNQRRCQSRIGAL